MARLPELVRKYAIADGRDLPTVKNIARTIREAGLITTTKRGAGASTMMERDAVNFLLGANGADTAAGAPEAVERIRNFRMAKYHIPGELRPHTLFAAPDSEEHLANVRFRLKKSMWGPLLRIGQFGEAFEWLVSNAPAIHSEMAKLDFAARQREFIEMDSASSGWRDSMEPPGGALPLAEHYAELWDRARDSTKFCLTLSRDAATFTAISPLEGFTGIEITYRGIPEKTQYMGHDWLGLRRALVEIDFRLIRYLAVLLSSPQSETHAASDEDMD